MVGTDVSGGSPAASRPQYYDRRPIKKIVTGNAVLGAASRVDTQDWSYTVPAGKKALIESAQASAFNDSVSALNANVQSRVAVTPAGSTLRVLLTARLLTGDTNRKETIAIPASGLLMPGDMIEGRSSGSNTAAGTAVTVSSGAMLTEFDDE